ncbi:MAG: hypothetical protein Q4Q17_05700 [Tissierellia bacterium]|nr:hypothetical protein [Tissierellia bacterium]
MSTIYQLTLVERGLLILAFAFLIIFQLYLIIIKCLQLKNISSILLTSIVSLFTNTIFIFLLEIHRTRIEDLPLSPVGSCMKNQKVLLFLLIWISFLIHCLYEYILEYQIYKGRITPASIKEGGDHLPIAMCFSDSKGRPMLTNLKMNQLLEELTGLPYQDMKLFWEKQSQSPVNPNIQWDIFHKDTILYRLRDGTIWEFSKIPLIVEGEKFVQTTGTNITLLYRLSQELEEKNIYLKKQNNRIKKLLEDIADIQSAEEVLASKAYIHHNLGQSILATKLYLTGQQHNLNRDDIFQIWKEMVQSLSEGFSFRENNIETSLRELYKVADAIGCTIDIKGSFPQNENISYLILRGIKESLTNAVKHGQADHLYVNIKSEKRKFMRPLPTTEYSPSLP